MERSDKAGATFNARYNDGDNIMTHTASLVWSNNPGTATEGTLAWNPGLFPAGSSFSRTSGHSLSPQLSGSYNIRLTDKWRFFARWGYAHFHNDAAYSYAQDALDPIVNITEEDVNYARGFAQIFWRPNGRIATFFEVNTFMNWYDTGYSGSTQTVSRQRRGETYANLHLYWALSVQPQATRKTAHDQPAPLRSGHEPQDMGPCEVLGSRAWRQQLRRTLSSFAHMDIRS